MALITACDVRLCSADAWFTIKEVDIGLAADIGTLQRLPRLVSSASLVSEWAFTGRRIPAAEAAASGLVSRVIPGGRAEVVGAAIELAKQVAAHSPIAVIGTKRNLLFTRDHGVDGGLAYVAAWNMGAVQTDDVVSAVMASMRKETPTYAVFPKL